MGVKAESLKRWVVRRDDNMKSTDNRGRPEAVPAEVRLKIRNCYINHYKQWGPRVLAEWAKREGLGSFSPSTISKIIEDIKDEPLPKIKPKRYEITEPNVMWSEDGAAFRERGKKKELLLLQDECSRFKVNTRLVDGPAKADDVCSYLREAFDKYGAPLILKHDGDSIFHEKKVQQLLDQYRVINLKSPPRYPPFNGKMERSIRDVKSYERAMHWHTRQTSLNERIDAAVHDLNDERPRPILGGKTARETFEYNKQQLPNRKRFYNEVKILEISLAVKSASRKEKDDARRKATQELLFRYRLIKQITDMSTYLKTKTRTN
jgi:transposase InsO family protein